MEKSGPVASVCALKHKHMGSGGQEEGRESSRREKGPVELRMSSLTPDCTLVSPLEHFHSVLEGTYTVS